jgi:hypothetical protein
MSQGLKSSALAQMEAFRASGPKRLSFHVSAANQQAHGAPAQGWTVVVKFNDKHELELSGCQAGQITGPPYCLHKAFNAIPAKPDSPVCNWPHDGHEISLSWRE